MHGLWEKKRKKYEVKEILIVEEESMTDRNVYTTNFPMERGRDGYLVPRHSRSH